MTIKTKLLQVPLVRWSAFVVAAAVAWGGYFAWRPPAPMLFMAHVEHVDPGHLWLTFDDGPHPLTTPLLLAVLRRAGVHATFFCIGDGVRLYPELTRRIAAEGHQLANHSESHHNLTTIPPGEFPAQIDACFANIQHASWDAGKPAYTKLFRPPGGGLNRAAMQYLYSHHDALGWWSNNVGDWTCPPTWKISLGVKANMRSGDIILLHDGGTGTPQAIPDIVKAAHARGFQFIDPTTWTGPYQ